jgi:glucarate dehydratase
LVKILDTDGRVGWGEACVGASSEAMLAALETMKPFAVGQLVADYEKIRHEVFHRGLWAYQAMTGSYAWCAYEMALLDLHGQAEQKPMWSLWGELQRTEVDYFYYFSRGNPDLVDEQLDEVRDGGYRVVYLKVGLDSAVETSLLQELREKLGPEIELRVDANGAWSVEEALEHLGRWSTEFGIALCEQPVPEFPPDLMQGLRRKLDISLAANEGMGPANLAEFFIREEVADVYTFSPYWVSGSAEFLRLSDIARSKGATICRHTHGELGIAATAFHHLALVTPGLGIGNQQTASELAFDVLETATPTRTSSLWGTIDSPGLGISIDEDAVEKASALYAQLGQFLPYSPER